MGNDVDVIVVPIGPDESWHEVRVTYSKDSRVRFDPIQVAHANAARNHGLAVARGQLVRFLDDDDYLVESGARAQYEAMRGGNVDICTGAVSFVDENCVEFDRYRPAQVTDLVSELFLQRPSTLPVAHVFRGAFLRDARWDTARPYLQDVDWLHTLIRRDEINWLPLVNVVGAWTHHAGKRTSRNFVQANPGKARKMAAEIIVVSIETLDQASRMSADRRKAAAKALWDYVPDSFIYAPAYWSRLARRARRLDGASRPNCFFYHRGLWRWLNPIAAEWLFLPLRVLNRWRKSWKKF
jgi:glycosyltransferase involved in cell wall biosynthesis